MIRDAAAKKLARDILDAAEVPNVSAVMIDLTASLIVGRVRNDELAQEVERKESVVTLLRAGRQQ